MAQSFSQYKISELWKNFLFLGSGGGWDSAALVQPPLSDGVGVETGLQLFPNRLVSVRPAELQGTIKLGDRTLRLSSNTTQVSEGSRTAIVSASQIAVVDGSRSIRLKPNSLVIDEIEYAVSSSGFTMTAILPVASALPQLSLVRVNSVGSLQLAQWQDAHGYTVLGGAVTAAFYSFGASAPFPAAERGQLWWADDTALSTTRANGRLLVGVSAAADQIALWGKDKLL